MKSLLKNLRSAPVTWIFALIDVVVFVIAEMHGSTTQTGTLLRFGASDPYHVWMGEYWRWVTPMFLHIGLTHLAWNLYASFGWCVPVEIELGSRRFAFVYLISGLGATLLSLLGHHVVSAGASGAGFGIIGARLVLLRRGQPSFNAFTRHPSVKSIVGSCVVWALLGTYMAMDQFAHLGGFLTGLAATWILTSPGTPRVQWAAFAAILVGGCVATTHFWGWHLSASDATALWGHGEGYLSGSRGYPKDRSRAQRFLRLSCDSGEPRACTNLATLFDQRDPAAAVLFQRACEGGEPYGCYNLAGIYARGEGNVQKDERRALDLYHQACEKNMWGGCVNEASFVSEGRITTRDYRRAFSLFSDACDKGDNEGCAGVGRAMYFGWGVEKEPVAGEHKVKVACAAGSKWACLLLEKELHSER